MSDFTRTNFGMKYGESEIRCFCSDKHYGTVGIVTPKTDGELTITFSPKGNVYIDYKGDNILAIKNKRNKK